MVKLDRINELLALGMENLLNNRDSNASKNETMAVEDAEALAHLGKVAIEGFKVKLQSVKMCQTDRPADMEKFLVQTGFMDEKK